MFHKNLMLNETHESRMIYAFLVSHISSKFCFSDEKLEVEMSFFMKFEKFEEIID